MATITPDNVFFLRQDVANLTLPTTEIERAWKDRLAGTAFVGATPMVGQVFVIDINAANTIGFTTIGEDGAWEIKNLAERYENSELIVIGLPSDTNINLAIASKIKPV